MDKRDFKNLLSEGFEKQDRKFGSLLKDSFERYDKKSKKFLKKTFEENNKKIKKDISEEFSRFVEISIVPQFDRIYTELKDIRGWVNDLSHRQDQILRTLVKHEDRFDHLGNRQDEILKVLEKQGSRLERIESKL